VLTEETKAQFKVFAEYANNMMRLERHTVERRGTASVEVSPQVADMLNLVLQEIME
jgi:hypothetical protein